MSPTTVHSSGCVAKRAFYDRVEGPRIVLAEHAVDRGPVVEVGSRCAEAAVPLLPIGTRSRPSPLTLGVTRTCVKLRLARSPNVSRTLSCLAEVVSMRVLQDGGSTSAGPRRCVDELLEIEPATSTTSRFRSRACGTAPTMAGACVELPPCRVDGEPGRSGPPSVPPTLRVTATRRFSR